ncbi:MAG TPA: hypothetical protein VFD48_16035, partial [Pyrinomonadaceae bacterium]|nr:hypothetical protein [Pyrinomonadaceae bacterium]
VYEFLGDRQHFNSTDRQQFSKSLAVPSETLIFLARHFGTRGMRTRAYHVPLVVGPDTPNPISVDGYTATFAIDQVALQIFTFRRPEKSNALGVKIRLPDNWTGASIDIWPPVRRSRRWPPPLALDDAGFELFARRWGNLSSF